MVEPTTISSHNINRFFEQDWSAEMGGLDLPINLLDQDNAFTRILNPSQKNALALADKNRDGNLTMREARDFLIQNNNVRNGGEFEDFENAINHLFTFHRGKRVDVTEANASVLYLQFNNNTTRGTYLYNGSRQALEKNKLDEIVRSDPDKASFDAIDMTPEFNKGPDEAIAAFRSSVQSYLDNLIETGGSMTGLIVSGHSGGDEMLFETPDHNYDDHLDIRGELMRFKEMEVPNGSGNFPYRDLFNNCEKVGLLACFQGGQNHRWARIFPNATIAGTQYFAPDSGSSASPAIYEVAARTRQALENGNSDTDARIAGLRAPDASRDGLQTHRGLTVRTPNAANTLRMAEQAFNKALLSYEKIQSEVEAVLTGKTSVTAGRLRQLYRMARTLEHTASSFNDTGGNAAFSDGAAIDIGHAKQLADRLFEMRFA